ncbi:DUF4913 domain-containing protein [Streptomyces sp. SAJ15]|uniref:DUF4913 domain-containing protein n=1 Tax=Streptomyces sp. SAJ15 TaxID=2011095 RepID=UPI001186CF60|nr:DUF4913 domain-containing protein [Streptomyces sp. SAJ15]TVL90521.1 DUF4913 domain-containing protein [Streptomyces sp. SAJ15]
MSGFATEADHPVTSFILYLEGEDQRAAMQGLSGWVSGLLLPVYGREVTSRAPWCPQWWEHLEAVAHLHALWLAWQELTGPNGGMTGPAMWHRDFLAPTMQVLRDPDGPFAGCKAGTHRPKEAPAAEPYPA